LGKLAKIDELNDAQITVKCVEVGKSLLDTKIGLANYELNKTRSIADKARFALSIRRGRSIDSVEMLGAISSALKIDFRVLQSEILPEFADKTWVDIIRDGRRITRVDERIPPIEDVLSTLGAEWRESETTEIEGATVVALEELSNKPVLKDSLISELDLEPETFQTVFDYGQQAAFLGSFVSEEQGQEVVWSPLYWTSNSNKVAKYLSKTSPSAFGTIGSLTTTIRGQPGIPLELLDSSDPVVASGIHHGYFPTVQVVDRNQKPFRYVFAGSPQFESDPTQDVFERSKIIVACIRHGQHHAEISRIKYPRLLLQKMRSNLMKPHPYASIQYALLVLHGIVRLEPAATAYGDAFKVVWIDTPENNLAADIAEQLLSGETAVPAAKEEVDARSIMLQGVWAYSSELRRVRTAQSLQATGEYNTLMERVAGVKI
jgi:hypothetical protein